MISNELLKLLNKLGPLGGYAMDSNLKTSYTAGDFYPNVAASFAKVKIEIVSKA